MKIVRLSTFLDFGGVEKRLTNIASINDSNEWIFCALNKGGSAEKEIQKKGKQVYCLNLSYKILNIKTLYKFYKFLKKIDPDVIHTSGAEANFYGILAAKLAGVPKIIAEEIGTPNHSLKGKVLFTTLYKFAHYIVGNSKPVTKYLLENNGVSRDKIKLIYNPVVFKDLESRVKSNDTFNIVSISRLEPVKNIEGMLKALKEVRSINSNFILTIVGDGILMNQLKEKVKDLNLSDNVNFVGYQSDPYKFLLQSDLYILNSFTEGFSNSLMEAMYSATPSISSKSGSAEMLINEGITGWITPVGDDEALRNKILHIMNLSSKSREKIGLNAKKYVIKNFSLQSHRECLLKIYK